MMKPEGTQKVLQQLGLCQRAGKIVSGEELVLDAIRRGKAKLVLLSEDASPNTAKRIKDKSDFYNVPLLVALNRGQIGDAIGKAERVVIVITDAGFAKMIGDGLKNLEVNGIG
jgi:ribosomal protein L7Ae-like RNA K-turn-binding protein